MRLRYLMRFAELWVRTVELLIVDDHATVQLLTLFICGAYQTWLSNGSLRVNHGTQVCWVEHAWSNAKLCRSIVLSILFHSVIRPILMTSASKGMFFRWLLTVRAGPKREILR